MYNINIDVYLRGIRPIDNHYFLYCLIEYISS